MSSEYAALHALPEGWTWSRLDQVAAWGSGGTPKATRSEYYGGSIPWAVIGDLTDAMVTTTTSSITERGLVESSAKLIEAGTILVAMYGSIGKLGIAGMRMATNQAIAFARPREDILDPKFLFWFLMHERRDFQNAGKGATQSNISQTVLKPWPIPVPPLSEQHRIVAAIEEQLSRLDAGVETLERTQRNLRRMRAAVLQAAVEGRLLSLEQPQDEDAVQYLARMDGHPSGSAIDRLRLPPHWTATTLEVLCPVFVDCAHRTPKYSDSGIPALRPRDVVGGVLHLNNAARVDEGEFLRQTQRRVPEAGDVIYSRELSYGWAAVLPGGVKVCLAQGMVLMRPHPLYSREFFVLFMNSPIGRGFANAAATGTAHPHINLKEIRQYPIPVPSPEEQECIVSEVGRRLSFIEATEKSLDSALTRAQGLRRIILKTAFEGRLVPQDPAEESAASPLARAANARRDGRSSRVRASEGQSA